jgi:hypothetical protein
VNTSLDRPRWRATGNYRIHQRLQIGLEYNPQAKEIGPLFSLFLFTETERRPALFLGTSSDRIGSPAGKQSYFATVSKYVPACRASFYASLNYSEWDAEFNAPFGASVEFGKGISVRWMYDGDRQHGMLNYYASRYGVSVMYVWLDTMGLTFSVGF